jgi:hypothetical protein
LPKYSISMALQAQINRTLGVPCLYCGIPTIILNLLAPLL